MRITNVLFVFFPHDMSGYFAREVGRSGGWLIKILREGLLWVLNPSIHHFSKKSKGWRVAKNNDLYNFSSDFYYFYNLVFPNIGKVSSVVVGLNCLIRDILNAFWLYRSKLLSYFSSCITGNSICLLLHNCSTILPYVSAEIPTAFIYTFNLYKAYREYTPGSDLDDESSYSYWQLNPRCITKLC